MGLGVRTWIEIDIRALRHNAGEFLKLIPKETRLMAVIKSNAYGHGLSLVAKSLLALRSFSEGGWFGVDFIVEALRLRKDGIKNEILVLGHTLPARLADAAKYDIIVSISNFESLSALAKIKNRPRFHLKLDTGMCRQGFLPEDMPRLIAFLKQSRLKPYGVFTHFASAKDPADPVCTRRQLQFFLAMLADMEKAGYSDFIRHAAATGGTLIFPEAHLDMVRIGMGLYGYWPSDELRNSNFEFQMKSEKKVSIALRPVLVWKSVVAEVKKIPKGSQVGYDGTERVSRDTMVAVIPIGYWHGYDRGLSGIGTMLVRGKRAKVLGRISMDMTVIDVTDIANARVGDEVALIGRQGKEAIFADELAAKINTTAYEFLTRINPLIKREIRG